MHLLLPASRWRDSVRGGEGTPTLHPPPAQDWTLGGVPQDGISSGNRESKPISLDRTSPPSKQMCQGPPRSGLSNLILALLQKLEEKTAAPWLWGRQFGPPPPAWAHQATVRTPVPQALSDTLYRPPCPHTQSLSSQLYFIIHKITPHTLYSSSPYHQRWPKL